MHVFFMLVAGLHSTIAPGVFQQPDFEQRAGREALPVLVEALKQESWTGRIALCLRERLEPAYRLPIRQTDRSLSYGIVKITSIGLGHEWYLGYGVSAGLEFEACSGGLGLPMNLYWYPIEGLQLSIGFDLFQWRVIGSGSWDL